jgi:predicted PurR-regulated permease PerM
MGNMETSTIISLISSVFIFVGGIVITLIKHTINNIEKSIEKLFSEIEKSNEKLNTLYGEHTINHQRKR